MTHMPVTTRAGGLKCLEATGRQLSQTDRLASWKATGVNNLREWLWNGLRAGWKLLALDMARTHCCFTKASLALPYLRARGRGAPRWTEVGTRLQPWLSNKLSSQLKEKKGQGKEEEKNERAS